jgi:hypothetical protein
VGVRHAAATPQARSDRAQGALLQNPRCVCRRPPCGPPPCRSHVASRSDRAQGALLQNPPAFVGAHPVGDRHAAATSQARSDRAQGALLPNGWFARCSAEVAIRAKALGPGVRRCDECGWSGRGPLPWRRFICALDLERLCTRHGPDPWSRLRRSCRRLFPPCSPCAPCPTSFASAFLRVRRGSVFMHSPSGMRPAPGEDARLTS